jgi:hypothetical protein
MDKRSIPEDQQAAAELYRLAQAARLLRLYRETEGRPAAVTPDELGRWVRAHPDVSKNGEPSPEDVAQVERDHPELAQRARGERPASGSA